MTKSEFEPELLEQVMLQAEARKAWNSWKGRELIVGAYYGHHRNSGWTRRILALKDGDVHWTDKFGASTCTRPSFVNRVAGPL